MDIENATEQPIIVQSPKGAVQFPLLNFRRLGKMLAELRAIRQNDLIESLKRAEVSDGDRVKALRDFDERSLSLGDGMRWCRSVEGAMATLSASLRVDQPNLTDDQVDAILDPISVDQLLLAAARLWGAVFQVGKEAEGEDKMNPLAQSPQPTSTGD